MPSLSEQQVAELMLYGLGHNNPLLLSSTTAVTGNFKKIQALTNTVFTTLTSNYTANSSTTAAVASDFGTLAAGQSIYGKFTAVTLTSGIAILY